jgi:archaellum component FlaC
VLTDSDVDEEIKSIKNRIAGIEVALNSLDQERGRLSEQKKEIDTYLYDSAKKFDEENIAKLSPIISAIEAAERAKALINLELTELHRHSAIVSKYQEANKTIDAKRGLVSRLRQSIKSVSEGLIGLKDVLGTLRNYLNEYLSLSGLQNVFGVSIDNKFIPNFRNISYYNTSSGGVRTITSIGGFLIRFRFLVEKFGYLPTFLMIYTPGQNIGRYVRQDEDAESSDPELYENIYKQLITAIDSANAVGKNCQIIVVDNDFPKILSEQPDLYHLVKRYSKHGGQYDKGLINDAPDLD